jgi:GNAT superfamily N-acetyltransferase
MMMITNKSKDMKNDNKLVSILKNLGEEQSNDRVQLTENLEDTLSHKYGVNLEVYEYDDYIELKKIVVPKDKRGGGIGSDVMEELIQYCKDNQKDLFTTPSSAFGGSVGRLTKFYKSLGFKDNKGRGRDFRSKESLAIHFN